MVSSPFSCVPVLLICLVVQCFANWQWVTHSSGSPHVNTGLAIMMSGSTPKLFGVGSGNLYERFWAGSSWVWRNHGAPSGLNSGEKLSATPCILRDGKLFIITSHGRLIERHWSANTWHWVHHNVPGALPAGFQNTRCTCTTKGGHRVFLLGKDRSLWERYWAGSAWKYRSHGKPYGNNIMSTGIDSCNQPTCEPDVYATGQNGYLYKIRVTANGGSWSYVGTPTGKRVQSVTVSNNNGGVFVTTQDNDVCQLLSNNFQCYGRPQGSTTSTPKITISKSVSVKACNKLPGYSQFIFVHSWDPKCQKQARFWSLKITSWGAWEPHGNICPLGISIYIPSYPSGHYWYIPNSRYVDSPEVFMNGGCPKVFTTTNNGDVRELYKI